MSMELVPPAALRHLHALDRQQLAEIAPYASELTVQAGRRLLLDGPFAQALVLVVGGRGRVRCAGETVAELGPGDVFGALAPQRTSYPTATVTASGELRLVMFSTRNIRRLRESAPATAEALLSSCSSAPQLRAEVPRLALVHTAAAA